MKKITEIEFINYKAFYQSGEENKITIPEGKSVLIYGENGSGKSSIYEGIKQFFNSADNTIEVIPSRHIAVPKTRIENEGTDTQTEVLNDVSVKVTFTDANGNEMKSFGVPISDTKTTRYISQANLLNSFLSYRELLRTYLMENPKDREEFRLKFALLLIEVILAKQKNSGTQQTYQKSWDDLFISRARFKEELMSKFKTGLDYDISRINLLLPTLLSYFEKGFSAQLEITQSVIEYYHSHKKDRWGKYPICEIDLKVFLFGKDTENEEENHLTVLNEARLSALAISIFLASLINTPQINFDYKILFLDDILIGLDMSNRLPLLEIIRNFKKPIIEQFVDPDNNNTLANRIYKIDGVDQFEEEPFFESYQKFISTYDRFWFQVAVNWFETKSQGKWCYLELFANQKPSYSFNTPLLLNSLTYFQKAEFYYNKHDYPSCANHLRKAVEKKIKELLPANEHYGEYLNMENGITEVKKLKTLNQYIEKFIVYCEVNGINASELSDLKNLKDWYFNPFSHDNIETPIFRRELELAKSLVKKLDTFKFPILVPAATRLFFRLDNGAGQTREYRIELQENLRWVKSVDGNIITNAAIQCYEWIQNADAPQRVEWVMNGQKPHRLISFYNNKWKHLMAPLSLPNVPMDTFWNEIFCIDSNQSLISII